MINRWQHESTPALKNGNRSRCVTVHFSSRSRTSGRRGEEGGAALGQTGLRGARPGAPKCRAPAGRRRGARARGSSPTSRARPSTPSARTARPRPSLCGGRGRASPCLTSRGRVLRGPRAPSRARSHRTRRSRRRRARRCPPGSRRPRTGTPRRRTTLA